MDFNIKGRGGGRSLSAKSAFHNGASNSSSNVMMSALFGSSQPSRISQQNLAIDRRAVLDLFSLYAKAVKIIWTFEATEFHCNADGGRCSFVTNDLESFLQHATSTSRCEACDQHMHCRDSNTGTVLLCEKCNPSSQVSSSNNADQSHGGGLLLDMTVDRNNHRHRIDKDGQQPNGPALTRPTVKPTDHDRSQNQLFGLTVIPESQVKVARRGRPPRPKLNSILNARKPSIDYATPEPDHEECAILPDKKTMVNITELSSSSLESSVFNTIVKGQELEQEDEEDEEEEEDEVNASDLNGDGTTSNCTDEELVECSHCGRLLRKESLRTHIARRHENARHHTCQFCDYQSYDAYVMREHMRRHLGQYLFKCDLCPFQAVKKYQLDSHMRRHTGEKPFRCDACSFRSAWKVQLKSHVPLHEQGTEEERTARTCGTCGVLFSSSGTFSRHPCIRGTTAASSSSSSVPKASEQQPATNKNNAKSAKKRLLVNERLTPDLNMVDQQEDQQLHDAADVINFKESYPTDSSNVILRKRSFRVPLVLPQVTPPPNSSVTTVNGTSDAVKLTTSQKQNAHEPPSLPIFQMAVATSTTSSAAPVSSSSIKNKNNSNNKFSLAGALSLASQQSSPHASSLMEGGSSNPVEDLA